MLESFVKNILLALIYCYRKYISPALEPRCRYYPTCSQYCKECISELPLHKALYYSILRILRCNPWGGSGYDPVPKK